MYIYIIDIYIYMCKHKRKYAELCESWLRDQCAINVWASNGLLRRRGPVVVSRGGYVIIIFLYPIIIYIYIYIYIILCFDS